MIITSMRHKEGHWWHWIVYTPLVTFKGKNLTKWGADRNVNRIWADLQGEPKSEKPL
jgi:hypothetical protein